MDGCYAAVRLYSISAFSICIDQISWGATAGSPRRVGGTGGHAPWHPINRFGIRCSGQALRADARTNKIMADWVGRRPTRLWSPPCPVAPCGAQQPAQQGAQPAGQVHHSLDIGHGRQPANRGRVHGRDHLAGAGQ